MLGGTAIVTLMLRGSATVTSVPVLVGGAPVPDDDYLFS
jgi:hypothetical protein